MRAVLWLSVRSFLSIDIVIAGSYRRMIEVHQPSGFCSVLVANGFRSRPASSICLTRVFPSRP
jgi:hypothetical protein